jgi:hypothetical protein
MNGKIVALRPGERPRLVEQSPAAWHSLVDRQVHPIKVAAVEALRWVGGPLSAREIWLLGVGDPKYQNVAYHVKNLADIGLLEQTHETPNRGSVEKFYIFRSNPGSPGHDRGAV